MKYEELLLSNQLCFLVYRLEKEINARYRPLLGELGLTYPQYLVMLVLWEQDNLPINSICERLKLDTGTISPLLKRLETAKLISRKRSKEDERSVFVKLTKEGNELCETAKFIPEKLESCISLTMEEYFAFKKMLEDLLNRMD
ncbi:MarR family transcriptional regulator [uncultured Bacteroides sp.]|uniref:MarR family winged helix-turn-helix transcriptional regulator n=1 Tax=uncultured Bacteroides sp. TaxID=162156 RepID=UPI002AA70DCE|nr:MarR family transcriptional regulator [uncultured Bacteroides sp.]